MSYRFTFPEGKDKALTFSYDDGNIADKRLVSIFNNYGLKATFHLNSGMLDGKGFIKKKEIKDLYKGHEIAGHGVHHEFMNDLHNEAVVREIIEDRRVLENYNDSIVVGYSYPYGQYNKSLIDKLKVLGIQYSRTVNSTRNFFIPGDFMQWNPTCHHNDVTDEMIEDFFNPPSYRELSLFYIWGHSFEFDRENTWDRFEQICDKLHGKNDVWYTTNFEFKEYFSAIRSVVTNVDDNKVYNPTGQVIWLINNNKLMRLLPGQIMLVK
ncbi:polysaccharide deacetylase family protein [Clostridium sp. SM-530-WT-3G]|uniref:polysaccharide deacetylase family protein n=1 Tax=Clostridium sp. SM-530-WT-3G TaxID=2725303 RepID=UPI00145CA303|nr:polysaccharide deacetylase family protein [Clostridium sp. SM-530-WT-3G]NME82924.1 polysaccharide deacetylase family protein [Clostridium sp. SM-530-WT-3G]